MNVEDRPPPRGGATFTVRRVRAEEWEQLRDLRLRALRSDPHAFATTFAEAKARTERQWRDWARNGATSERNCMVVAERAPGPLLGLGAVFLTESHFTLVSMWVDPSARGRGIGGAIVESLLAWAERSIPGVEVRLDVNPEQEAAVALYRSHGFQETGVEEPLGHSPPAMVRQMIRPGRPVRAP